MSQLSRGSICSHVLFSVCFLAAGAGAIPATIIDGPPLDNRVRVTDIGFMSGLTNLVYYRATTEAEGAELWRSDGTANGTYIVKDIVPGPESSEPSSVVYMGNVAYFAAWNGPNGRELWKTDGTAAGTAMLKDIRPGAEGSDPADLTVMSGYILFTANDGTNGRELWKTDGTPEGTVLLYDFNTSISGGGPSHLTRAGEKCFLAAMPNYGTTPCFYVTNGTTSGTLLLMTAVGLENFCPVGDTLYYSGGDSLWKSDGTVPGTVEVKNLYFDQWGTYMDNFVEYNSILYFSAKDKDVGFAVWSSDGTAEGTHVAVAPPAGSELSYVRDLTVYNGSLVYSRLYDWWKSNGTQAGTTLLKSFSHSEPGLIEPCFAVANGLLFGVAPDAAKGVELWKTDGTPAGTVIVKDIAPGGGSSEPETLTSSGNKLFFTAQQEGSNYPSLFVTDGTVAGTLTPKPNCSYLPAIWSNKEKAGELGENVYFREDSSVYGWEVWGTEGPAARANLLKDIWQGANSSHISLVSLNGLLYIDAVVTGVGREPWISDGTTDGTVLLGDLNPGDNDSLGGGLEGDTPCFTAVGNTVFFVANDGVHGFELWETDGTPAGTAMVKDIDPDPQYQMFQPRNLIAFDGALYFSMNSRLWRSDGTDSGTQQVSSIASEGPYVEFGGRLFFAGTGGLCQSDGTSEGTSLVKAISPATGEPGPSLITCVGDKLFFMTSTSETGTELWVSDGTGEGTNLVADIVAGTGGSGPADLVNFNGLCYFTVDDKVNGRELWRSDGTPTGTVMVKDICPGLASSKIKDLFVAPTLLGDILLFAAANADSGVELWASDGTENGTILLSDVAVGTGSSNPMCLTYKNDLLYFRANDGYYGNRVRVLNLVNGDLDGDGMSSQDETRDLDPNTPGVQNPFNPFNGDSTGDSFSDEPDGVPDGQNDYDGDGVNNQTEVFWHSDPTDPDSVVTLPAVSSLGAAMAILCLCAISGLIFARQRRWLADS